jgi:hypothetical protein
MTSLTAITNGLAGDNPVVCTDGTSLPDFVQTAGKLFTLKPAVSVSARFSKNSYYAPEGNRSTVTTVLNQMTAVPFFVSNTESFDRIGAEVTTVGTAGSVVRLGIYADSGVGQPGALVLDAGTIAGDVQAAAEITINVTLPAGLYWLAAVGQTIGTPIMRCLSATNTVPCGVATLAVATGASPQMGHRMAGVTAGLPNPFVVGGQSAGPVLVVMRASS